MGSSDITDMAFLILLLPLLLHSATSASEDPDWPRCPMEGYYCDQDGSWDATFESWHECGQMCEEDGACQFWSWREWDSACVGHYQEYCETFVDGMQAVSGKRGCK